MTDAQKRVFALAERLGLNTEPGSRQTALFKSWCAGLEMLRSDFDIVMNQLNPMLVQSTALGLFCSLFGIDGSLPVEQKRNLIKQGFCRAYGEYELGEFRKRLEECGLKATVMISRMTIKSSLGSIKDNSSVSTLGGILKNYLPPGVTVSFNGWGLDFDYWNSTDYLFEDYDNLDFTINMLETLT